MEKIGDILNNIKERFSNPLIFSFICSWLVINWQITVAFVKYDQSQIKAEGYRSIFDFISAKLNQWNSLWIPLIAAGVYTLLMPLLRIVIKAFYTLVTKWGENWNLKMLKEGKISIDKYLKLRSNYAEKREALVKIVEEENEKMDQMKELELKITQGKATEAQLREALTESTRFIQEQSDVRILNGRWRCEWETSSRRDKGEETALIREGSYSIIGQLDKKTETFTITTFYYDSKAKSIFLVKERNGWTDPVVNGYPKYNINILKFENSRTLVGTENGTTIIRYVRID
jgi:hypothetical protein